MKKVLDTVDWLVGGIMVVLITIMILVGGAQVFCRYILHNSLSWSEELMRFLYVWIVMVGINLGIRHKTIAAITSLSDLIAKHSVIGARIIAVFCFLVQLLSCAVLFYFGLQFTLANKQFSPAMHISMSIIYCALPVGGAMSVIYTIDGFAEWLKGELKKSQQ